MPPPESVLCAGAEASDRQRAERYSPRRASGAILAPFPWGRRVFGPEGDPATRGGRSHLCSQMGPGLQGITQDRHVLFRKSVLASRQGKVGRGKPRGAESFDGAIQ